MIKVIKEDGYKKVVTIIDISVEGNTVYECVGKIVPKPTRTSIETPNGHMEDNISACVNHNCNPNVKLEFTDTSIKFINTKEILEGCEVTFDYNTTEYELALHLNVLVVVS